MERVIVIEMFHHSVANLANSLAITPHRDVQVSR